MMKKDSNKRDARRKPRGEGTAVKLNYKRTFLIGFAFFGILLLW